MSTKLLLLTLLLIFLCPSIIASDIPNIQSDAAIVIETTTNTILYRKNANLKFYPADTVNLLTAYLAMQDLPLNMPLSTSPIAFKHIPIDSPSLNIAPHTSLTVRDALYAILLTSDSHICHDLAYQVSGGITPFAKKMNSMALSCNSYHSNFVNPYGYYNTLQYTTALDLANLAYNVFSNPTLEQICGTFTHDIKLLTHNQNLTLTNTSKLLDPNSRYYNKYVVASKAGYSQQSKEVLVSKARYKSMELIIVTMRADSPNQYIDTQKLINYCIDNFHVIKSEDSDINHLYNKTFKVRYRHCIINAIENNWITHTGVNYDSYITRRDCANLLKSCTTNKYNTTAQSLINYNSDSLLAENLLATRTDIAILLYKYLSKLDVFPAQNIKLFKITDIDHLTKYEQQAIYFCVNAGLLCETRGKFYPNNNVSYESAISIMCNTSQLLQRYHEYNFPTDDFIRHIWDVLYSS